MSDKDKHRSDDWINQWMQAQQNFWQSWTEMARQAGMMPSGGTSSSGIPADHNFWSQGLENWWKAVSPATPEPVNEMFQRVMEISRQFTRFAEQGYMASQDRDSREFISDWLNSMEEMFTTWIGQLSGGNQANLPDWLGLRKDMLASWDQFASQLTSGFDFTRIDMPGLLKGKEELDRILNIPAFGQWREHQYQLQQIARCAIEYQEADLAFKLAFAKVGLKGVEKLRQRLEEMIANGEKTETFRELYDLWVDVNEEVYGEFAMTDEYQVIYGDLTNSLMALRKEINVVNEKMHKAMNIPTRSEVNTINMRLQEQRRETRRLRAELDALTRQVQQNNKAGNQKEGKAGSRAPGRKPASKDRDAPG